MKSARVILAAAAALIAAALVATTANANFALPGLFPSPTGYPSPPPYPTVDLCDGMAGPDEICVIDWGIPYGPYGPAGPGEADDGRPTPSPRPCPVPLPSPPDSNAESVLDLYLVCDSTSPSPIPTSTIVPFPTSPASGNPFPIPSATAVPFPTHSPDPFPSESATYSAAPVSFGRTGLTRVAIRQDDASKHIGSTSFAMSGSKPLLGGNTTYKKGHLIIAAKEGVQEFNGVIVVDVTATTPDGRKLTQKIRFTTFSARGKFKDPNTGKEIDGFKAEVTIQGMELPPGTKVENVIKGVIGAVLLKDETEDRPLTFGKPEKFEWNVKD